VIAVGPTPDQDKALNTLVERGTITADQAVAVRRAIWVPGTPGPVAGAGSVLVEVAGYVGGGLMLGGAGLLVGLNSERLGRDGTAIVLACYAAALALAAVILAGGPQRIRGLGDGSAPVRRRLVGVLLALSSGPAAIAVAVAVATSEHEALWSGLVGLGVAVLGYALLPTVPGMLAVATMSVVATAGAIELDPANRPHVPTFAFLGLGVLWGLVSATGLARPRHIGLAIGAGLAVVGAQLELGAGDRLILAYSLTFAVAVACFVGYWLQRATVLLAFGVIAATIAIPEAVSDWTDDSLGGPAILLISGAVLIAASALGLWLRSIRRTTSTGTTSNGAASIGTASIGTTFTGTTSG
jgi:hypothetical protein